MKALSVNLGAVRTVEIKGRLTDTSIFKVSVAGPHRVGVYGIEGDARVDPRKQFGEANHAVYAYPYEHYGFWQQQLGRGPFPPGQFGENLTTLGLLETEVRIGDVLRCGSVVMQVKHPRIPCRKLNACMEQNIARAFLESRRLGFYLRVCEPGQLQAGDDIALLDRDESSPTMDDFIRISQIDYWDADGLARLLRARDLVPGWQEVLQEKLERARSAEGWFGQRELEVIRRDDEEHGFCSYELRCARGLPLPRFFAGQQLLVAPRGSSSQDVVRRPLLLSSDPQRTASYRVTTLAAEEPLTVGDCIRAAAPRGTFGLRGVSASASRLRMVSAGLGLAPLLSMLYELSRQAAPPPIHLIQVGRDYPRRLWDELQQLAGRMPTLHVERAERAATFLAALEPSAHTATLLAGPSAAIEEVETRLRAQSSLQERGLLQVLALRRPEPPAELAGALATP